MKRARPAQAGSMQRRACGGACARCAQRDVAHHADAGLASAWQPLDPGTRYFMESRFGATLNDVRVHTDGRAAESARGLNALAYTVGNDIVFGAGQYVPGTPTGNRLLAHELTHVMQQTGSNIASGRRLVSGSDPAESEARLLSHAIATGRTLSRAPTQKLTSASVSRQTDDGGDDGAQQEMGGSPLLGEPLRLPLMDDVVKSQTVDKARAQDWNNSKRDFMERGGWVRWQGSPRDPATGLRDDTRGFYVIERWPDPSVGAQDEAESPFDSIEPGHPPANDSLTFNVGHYHTHPPLDPSMNRNPDDFPVGPSQKDRDLASDLGSPGVVRDFTDTKRTVELDYRYGPAVQGQK